MPKYSLVYCKTPKDFIKMYTECGYSCMSPGSDYALETAQELWENKKLWASMWYAYFPGIKGLMLKEDDKLIARQFLWKDEYVVGPIYGSDRESYCGPKSKPLEVAEFDKLTKAKGYKKWNMDIKSITIPKPFKVPRVYFKKRTLCPLPFCDFVRTPFYVTYDSKSRSFIFSGEKKDGYLTIYDPYEYNMWIEHSLKIYAADGQDNDKY